jgi:DNA-binding LacI/PurR family transcriptional regulator
MTRWTVDIPKCDRIAVEIAGRIRSGEIPGASRLNSIRGLALQYGVSNKVVELALEQLEKMGLVERQVGRGTFVKSGFSSDASACEQVAALVSYYHSHNFEAYLYGLTDELLHHNMSLLYSTYNCEMSPQDKAAALALLEKMSKRTPDFLLIDALYLRDFVVIKDKLPVAKTCLVHNELPYKEFACPGVFVDYVALFRSAYEYLLRRGHRNILAVGFNSHSSRDLHPRELELSQALEQLGERLGSECFPYVSMWDAEAGIADFDKQSMPTAMVGLSDYSCYLAAAGFEKMFPGMPQMEIVGVYDTPWSRIPGREFHTFNLNFDQIWSKAISLVSGPESNTKSIHWIEPTFIERKQECNL